MPFFAGFLLPLGLSMAKGIGQLARVMRHRRQLHELAHWDSHALKDIGLTQSDVAGALSLPLHRDPSEHLAQISGRAPRLNEAVERSESRKVETGRVMAYPAPCPPGRASA